MWKYGGVRIFVTDIQDDVQQIVARLNPIAGGTVMQIFGWDDPVYKIDATIVGEADHASLVGMRDSGTDYDLLTPETTISGLVLSKASFRRVYTIGQTLRPDLDCTAPVYEVSLELFLDVNQNV